MKGKTSNHITVVKNSDKKVTIENDVLPVVLGDYFNIHTFQKHPITSNFMIQEALRLKQWAEEDDSLRISDFFDSRGYSRKMFYEWVHKHHEFEIAHEYAMRRIGARRENGALTRKFAETTVHKTLGHYDYVWREEIDRANAARLAVADKAESKLVIMERYQLPDGDYRDVEVISVSKFTPEEVAANIRRNTATDRQVKVNAKVGDSCE